MSGPELKVLRESAHMTLEQVAQRGGWPARGSVSRIENQVAVTDRTALRYVLAVAQELVGRASA